MIMLLNIFHFRYLYLLLSDWYMARKKVAVEFFEVNLPEHTLFAVDLSTFKLEKSDFIDKTLGHGAVDMLFSV